MLIRLTWRRAALALAGLALAVVLFAASGLFNVAASGGHWAITDWALHAVMRQSVRVRALLVEAPPPLADRALQARGAGHYASGCAPCHGAPGEAQSPIVQHSTPPPPDFSRGIAEWSDAQLFRIVAHGVRYTGMPAWPAHNRPDEVWSLVAFLRAMPGLGRPDYQRLAHGAEAPRPTAALAQLGPPPAAMGGAMGGEVAVALAECARCHNRDGLGRDGTAFPIIAGQSETYLLQALRAYAAGTRHSGIMQPAAARADDATLQALAAHYASQPRAAQPAAGAPQGFDPVLLAEGGAIAEAGLPMTQVPACLSCHGAAAMARNPAWPRLHGQHAAYLENQLALWREEGRGGGPFGPVMQTIGARLTPRQAQAVSAWFASRVE